MPAHVSDLLLLSMAHRHSLGSLDLFIIRRLLRAKPCDGFVPDIEKAMRWTQRNRRLSLRTALDDTDYCAISLMNSWASSL